MSRRNYYNKLLVEAYEDSLNNPIQTPQHKIKVTSPIIMSQESIDAPITQHEIKSPNVTTTEYKGNINLWDE